MLYLNEIICSISFNMSLVIAIDMALHDFIIGSEDKQIKYCLNVKWIYYHFCSCLPEGMNAFKIIFSFKCQICKRFHATSVFTESI